MQVCCNFLPVGSFSLGALISDVPAPEVSVVVPTFNGAHRLVTLFEQLADQTFPESWEVVVSVDGSTDGTHDLLANWISRLPIVTVVSIETNGSSAALARGYAAATGTILIRCDDDLTPGPDFIARHASWHQGTQDVGVIGLTRNVYPPSRYARAYGISADERAREAGYCATNTRWRYWAANNSIRRGALDLVGGFDLRFTYGADSEFGWRLAESGVTIVIDPLLEVPHRGPALNVESRASRAFVSGASRRLFSEVHPGVDQVPLGNAKTIPKRLWRAAVRVIAGSARTQSSYRNIGRAIDATLAGTPVPIGRRMIALVVESAGLAGYRYGSTEMSTFAEQKQLELAAELQSNE